MQPHHYRAHPKTASVSIFHKFCGETNKQQDPAYETKNNQSKRRAFEDIALSSSVA
jgi:hypothetical protein